MSKVMMKWTGSCHVDFGPFRNVPPGKPISVSREWADEMKKSSHLWKEEGGTSGGVTDKPKAEKKKEKKDE